MLIRFAAQKFRHHDKGAGNLDATEVSVIRQFQPCGTSLVEVMVTVAILSVVLLPLFGMLSMSIENNKKAINLTISARISEQVMGELQQADWATLDAWSAQDLYFDELGIKIPGATADTMASYTARVKVLPAGMQMMIWSTGPTPNKWGRQVITLVTSGSGALASNMLDSAAQALQNKTEIPRKVYVSRSLLANLEKDPTP